MTAALTMNLSIQNDRSSRSEAALNSISHSALRIPHFRHARGLSLLEMLVAVGLLAVIIIGLLAMFNQTQKTLHRGVAQVDILENGRAIMLLLERELQGMSAPLPSGITNPPPPAVFYAVEPRDPNDASANGLLKLPIPGANTNLVCELQGVAFHTRFNDEWTTSYYGFTNRDAGVATLCHAVRSGAVTNLPDFFPLPQSWNDPVNPSGIGFRRVADGIVHFKLLAYTPDGFLITTNSAFSGIYRYRLPYLPAHVDVELGILEPKSLERLNSMPDNNTRRNYVVNHPAEVHFFRQRVPIRSYNPDTYQ